MATAEPSSRWHRGHPGPTTPCSCSATALAQDVEGAADLALACAGALRERGFYGDGDLADHLEALAGKRAPLPLVPLPVDLDDLATVLEGDPIDGGGRIDCQTGEVWHRAAVE